MFVWSLCQQVCTHAAAPIPLIILKAHVPKMGEQAYEVYGKSQQAKYFNQVI
jgi:hypothetical protein